MCLKVIFPTYIFSQLRSVFDYYLVSTKLHLFPIFSTSFLSSASHLPSFNPSILFSFLALDIRPSSFSAFSLQLVDYYTDGQPCDETGGTRSTDVHIQCCTGLHVNLPNKDIVTSVTQRNQPHARLNGNPNPPVINEVHTHTHTHTHTLILLLQEGIC